MVENRGSFYQSKIIGIENEVEKLQSEKIKLEKALKTDYKILNQTNLIEDINAIIGDREELNTQLAEVNIQIGNHEKVNTLKREIATLKGQRLALTQQKMDEFNSHEGYIEKLESKFHELSQIAYDILGSFNVEFETDVSDKKDSTTGRIKIKCTLPDDRSHGINYMKINLFDLTWFLTSLENAYGHQLELLIHDGSYSKSNPTVKAKILKYVNTSLVEIGKGQYFVTLNKDELLAADIDEFKKQGLVTVLLERTQDNKKRFFGFKLYE
ncbi:DUF2326 domain-containing protein [Lysinibacillus sp. NPDC048646]|uniref:DUF2326 domain-containing protein n=1 Tax=Lysinibacillus sp. NPDC048646 TaxID=3390574 RepID=UPI003D005458